MNFMYYLIKFRRSRQELINLTTFDSRQSGVNEMRTAERANHDDDVEIVLLSAESDKPDGHHGKAASRSAHERFQAPNPESTPLL
jgi:hypothetical protein